MTSNRSNKPSWLPNLAIPKMETNGQILLRLLIFSIGLNCTQYEALFIADDYRRLLNLRTMRRLSTASSMPSDYAQRIETFIGGGTLVQVNTKQLLIPNDGRRCEFLDAIGDEKKYISAKLSMFNRCPLPEEEDALKEQVDEAYSLAIKCHETGKMKYAQKAFNCALKHCSKYFSAKHFSLLTNTQLLTDPSAEVIEVSSFRFNQFNVSYVSIV